jgi:serine phosphatase RsbU (regulator of sigma subunit)/pSer/pThr/pTyr-binding forkhead associated (FHA) protein
VTSATGPRLAVRDLLGRRVVAIDKPIFTIGRRDGHDLQLAGNEVSRDHAEIVSTTDGFVIRDRGSRYGTFVNREQVTEGHLAHGDRIELGRSGASLTFLLGDASADDDSPPAPTVGDFRLVTTLLNGLREMGGDRVLDEVLALVIDAAIEATGAERGFIMLADDRGALEMKLARRAGHVTLPAAGFETSRKIPEQVFATGQLLVVTDLFEEDLAAVHTGTVALGIRHVLCAPLRLVRYVERIDRSAGRHQIGVLYLDSREKGLLLSLPARAALEALATEAALAIENARLYQEGLEKARLDEELRRASRIQQALLPDGRRAGPFFDAVGASIPSRAIGGDFFDYQDLREGRFGFGLGDITGKGPPAALLTALVQGILAAHASTTAKPDEVIAFVNRVLLSRRIESRFLTLFLGALSPDGRLTFCNAAQNPPLLFAEQSARRLETGGTLVGAFEDATYDRETLQLASGDTIVLYSDGITEAMNGDGEEFGEDRLRDIVQRSLAESPGRILQAVFEAVHAFAHGAPQNDDLTAVVLRFGPPPQ